MQSLRVLMHLVLLLNSHNIGVTMYHCVLSIAVGGEGDQTEEECRKNRVLRVSRWMGQSREIYQRNTTGFINQGICSDQ